MIPMANSSQKRLSVWGRIAWVAGCLVVGGGWVHAGEIVPGPADARKTPPPSNQIFQAHLPEFGRDAYVAAVDSLVAAFEQRTGRALQLGSRGRVGLKVYSDSGAGLGTPLNLTRALIAALEKRGIARQQIVIVGLNEAHLREAGYLPPLSIRGNTFEGVAVIALNSGEHWEPNWFYDSPLPGKDDSPLNDEALGLEQSRLQMALEADRRSFLPVPLMFDVDFWINLPVCSDHPVVGVNAALVNITLWNASNTQRFFRSPASAPAAVAEMAAIPELRQGLVFHLVSLERYQFIGGPIFNSLYTLSEPLVWLSDNPVMIDSLFRDRIDRGREETGFRGLPEDLRLIPYAEQLGLGSGNPARIEWIEVKTTAGDEPRGS
jgi:hypothetical protein